MTDITFETSYISPELTKPKNEIVSIMVFTVEECRRHLENVKALLDELRTANPDNNYPTGEAIDDLATNVNKTKPLIFSYAVNQGNPTAVTIGVQNKSELDLRWVISTEPGQGISLIKDSMKKYDKINLKAAPYGYKHGEQETQLEKVVKYYKKLGFDKTRDYKDEKYGGTIPMFWQYNKLMGKR